MSETEYTEPHYRVKGEMLKDIYPLIGGKHKKWRVYALCIDKNTNEIVEKSFESETGNQAKAA